MHFSNAFPTINKITIIDYDRQKRQEYRTEPGEIREACTNYKIYILTLVKHQTTHI